MQVRADPFDAGPYSRVQAYLGLIKSNSLRVGRRAALAAIIAWVPLVLLAAVQGLAMGSNPQQSMLLDVAVHARFLISLPLLLIAEAVCPRRLASIARHFGDAGLIADSSRSQYDALLETTRRLLASPRTDLTILVLAYALTLAVQPLAYSFINSTWIRPDPQDPGALSMAGWWLALVSRPLYLVLMLGWVWRVVLWARFLQGVSQLELILVPAHPDRVGGLAFAGTSIRAFLLLAFALAVPAAGALAQEILHHGRSVYQFKYVIAGVVVAQFVLFAGPLFLLGPALLRARTKGIFEYGTFADAVGREFEDRWLKPATRSINDPLSAPDFSATTDLYSIVANVHEMRLVPLSIVQVGLLLTAGLLPFLPVLLATLPTKAIFAYVAKLLL